MLELRLNLCGFLSGELGLLNCLLRWLSRCRRGLSVWLLLLHTVFVLVFILILESLPLLLSLMFCLFLLCFPISVLLVGLEYGLRAFLRDLSSILECHFSSLLLHLLVMFPEAVFIVGHL